MKSNLYAIIMAGGKGTRIGATDKPKVMFKINSKPMLEYVVKTLKDIGVDQPIVVVGFQGACIRDYFGAVCDYVEQPQQMGTGHAVMMAEPMLRGKPGITLILSGDHPYTRTESLNKLIQKVENGATVALLTGVMQLPAFDAFGRVLTDRRGHVIRVAEVKDATDKEKLCRRMGFGTYAVKNEWLWNALKRVPASPVTGEYYLTDIVRLAVEDNKKVAAVDISDAREAIGINTLDHLKEAEQAI